MKKIIYKLIDFYLAPLTRSPALALFAKHRILLQSEHLHSAVHMIKKENGKAEGAIIDAGAFNGSTTVFFAQYFKSSKVIGFEPNPATFALAREKCKAFPNITMKQIGLDNETGEKDFFVSDNEVSSSLNPIGDNVQFHLDQKIKVKVDTLDNSIPGIDSVLLIKMDTQGRELNILKGATETLKKTRYILTEMNNHSIYKGGCQYFEVDEYLRKHNFRLVNITSGYNYSGVTEFDALYKNSSL